MDIFYRINDYATRAVELIMQDEYIKAKHLLEEVLEQEPDYSDAHLILGRLYAWYLDDMRSGLYHMQLAVRYDENNFYTVSCYAYLLNYTGHYTELIRLVNRCFEINMKNAWLLSQLGYALELTGQLNEAENRFREAIMLTANDNDVIQYESDLKRIRKKLSLRSTNEISVKYVIHTTG